MKLRLLFRKFLLLALVTCPFASVSHAASYKLNVTDEDNRITDTKVDFQEFAGKLTNGRLARYYYEYLEKNGIDSVDEVLLDENTDIRNKLLEHYSQDRIRLERARNGIESGGR